MGEVICLGIAVLDVIQRVPEPPPWGLKSVARSTELAAGGPATNAAVTAARLLGRATLVTALGAAPAAEMVRADLARHGVDVVDLADQDWELPVSTCLVGDDGERTVVCVGATGTSFPLTRCARDRLAGEGPRPEDAERPRAADAPSGRRVLLLDGHHPVAAEQALSARPEGCTAVLDAGSVKPYAESWLARLDVVAGSADYAAGLGFNLPAAVRHVLEAGAGAAVMTDGPDDVHWAEQGAVISRTAPPRARAVDTLGAGDAFHGALAAGLALGFDLGAAVALGCRVASTRVAHQGARGWLAHVAPLRVAR